MDANGLSDPYCKIKIAKKKYKTKIISKNLNPVWNEKFVVDIGEADEEVCFETAVEKYHSLLG